MNERTFIASGILRSTGDSVISIDSMAFISASAADTFFEREATSTESTS